VSIAAAAAAILTEANKGRETNINKIREKKYREKVREKKYGGNTKTIFGGKKYGESHVTSGQGLFRSSMRTVSLPVAPHCFPANDN
jgi:hypothetical protein